jgi:hypothetical protein
LKGFGGKTLRRMGWTEGSSIGKAGLRTEGKLTQVRARCHVHVRFRVCWVLRCSALQPLEVEKHAGRRGIGFRSGERKLEHCHDALEHKPVHIGTKWDRLSREEHAQQHATARPWDGSFHETLCQQQPIRFESSADCLL